MGLDKLLIRTDEESFCKSSPISGISDVTNKPAGNWAATVWFNFRFCRPAWLALDDFNPTEPDHFSPFSISNDQFATKERLCHSTPSGGYCVNGVLSSPSMAVKLLASWRNAFQAGEFCLDFPLINQPLPGVVHIHNGHMHFIKKNTLTHIEERGIWMIIWLCFFPCQYCNTSILPGCMCFFLSAEQRLSRFSRCVQPWTSGMSYRLAMILNDPVPHSIHGTLLDLLYYMSGWFLW